MHGVGRGKQRKREREARERGHSGPLAPHPVHQLPSKREEQRVKGERGGHHSAQDRVAQMQLGRLERQ
eukprot:6672346-Prymnesium_polylepis.2